MGLGFKGLGFRVLELEGLGISDFAFETFDKDCMDV